MSVPASIDEQCEKALDLPRGGGSIIDGVDERMTIGEFSTRTGLSARVLRSYAELGVLVPCAVDPVSGYRYYNVQQLDEAALVTLLRRAGVAVADVGRFLAAPSDEAIDGWERSLAAEVHARRQALAEVRGRLSVIGASTRGATVMEIRPVANRDELRSVFDLVGGQIAQPLDTTDFRYRDLDRRFPDDGPLMVVAVTEGRSVGGALAFRNDDGAVTLRMIAVVEAFRHRGIGRRLVERIEAEARLLGVETIGLGTDEAEVGFYFHLGYTPNLLLQWAYDAKRYEQESEAVLAGPLSGLQHWRSSFNDIPQLFVEMDGPRLDLPNAVRDMVSGGHVGFMMTKKLTAAALAS